jgi:putative ABC transport system permease protein
MIMFKNYFKIAFRNIRKYKGYSFINIASLAIGIACCMLIIFYVGFELSYDNYHKGADRIYRIGLDRNLPWEKNTCAMVGYPLAAHLKKNLPQVEYAGRIQRRNVLIKKEDKVFYENDFFYVDKDIFNIFTIPFIKGNAEQALINPETIVISQSMANKYFGEEDPLGRMLTVDANDFQITGIVKDPPSNTHFKYSFITSLNDSSLPERIRNSWTASMIYTYLKLAPNTDTRDFARMMNKALESHIDSETLSFFLQPVKDIHLHSHLLAELEPPGNPFYLYIFSTIAVLILMIASINFINLSTARSANRAKEIGIRKVVGAFRNQLINQFIGESVFTTILSVVAAFVIVDLSLPFFNRLVDIQFTVSDFFKLEFFISLICIILFSGIIAGSYPAVFLSAFKPALVLKGKLRLGTKRSALRKIMVIGQFTVSIILVISTITSYRQLRFMKNEKLGFSKEQKLIIPVQRGADISKNYGIVKSEFLKHSWITGAAVSGGIPGRIRTSETYRLFNEAEDKGQQMKTLFIDKDFIPEYGIEIAVGRSIFKETDSLRETEFLINETAVRALGLHSPQDAVGKRLVGWEGGKIVGVVKDFHFEGLQQEIEPLVITNFSWMFSFITLTVSPEEISRTLSFVRNKWKELFPGIPYEYYFLDEDFNRLYRSEERTGTLIGVFTLIGVLVACFGLFGLASFMVEQRTKEIAIRKVHGARVSDTVSLLIKDFIKWILISNIIAWPVAYFVVNRWLQNFFYRLNLGVGIFIFTGLIVLAIALLTISYQVIKTTTTNPVDYLRYE